MRLVSRTTHPVDLVLLSAFCLSHSEASTAGLPSCRLAGQLLAIAIGHRSYRAWASEFVDLTVGPAELYLLNQPLKDKDTANGAEGQGTAVKRQREVKEMQ